MSENVLVVQNELLQSLFPNKFKHIITNKKEQIINAIINNHLFMPRHKAEYNPEFRQVIPYVIIRNHNNYLLLKRTSKQTEKRLHNKYSLGIGGHINPDSSIPQDNIVINGLYKELNEEIQLKGPYQLNFKGVIIDESTSVSKVHLGLLYIFDVKSPEYKILEDDKMSGQWVSREKLNNYYDNLETWSQIVYDYHINNAPQKNV